MSQGCITLENADLKPAVSIDGGISPGVVNKGGFERYVAGQVSVAAAQISMAASPPLELQQDLAGAAAAGLLVHVGSGTVGRASVPVDGVPGAAPTVREITKIYFEQGSSATPTPHRSAAVAAETSLLGLASGSAAGVSTHHSGRPLEGAQQRVQGTAAAAAALEGSGHSNTGNLSLVVLPTLCPDGNLRTLWLSSSAVSTSTPAGSILSLASKEGGGPDSANWSSAAESGSAESQLVRRKHRQRNTPRVEEPEISHSPPLKRRYATTPPTHSHTHPYCFTSVMLLRGCRGCVRDSDSVIAPSGALLGHRSGALYVRCWSRSTRLHSLDGNFPGSVALPILTTTCTQILVIWVRNAHSSQK